MAPNPQEFLTHLRDEGYHPRSSKHSNALAECIASDLFKNCPAIRRNAAEGRLVYDLNFTLLTGISEWNIDLVLGEPPPSTEAPTGQIARTRPSTVQIAIELKAVMTEHRKAVKNRKRDFEAHHDHVHRYNPRAIAGGVLLINASAKFRSPLRDEITEHKNPQELVRHCVEQMRAVTVRGSVNETGLDAKAVVVVDTDNVDHKRTCYFSTSPAPKVGDPLHYDAFIQAICAQYTQRFGSTSL